jgi:hypothetical protein
MVAGVGAGMRGRQSSKSRYTRERPFCLTATTETIQIIIHAVKWKI